MTRPLLIGAGIGAAFALLAGAVLSSHPATLRECLDVCRAVDASPLYGRDGTCVCIPKCPVCAVCPAGPATSPTDGAGG